MYKFSGVVYYRVYQRNNFINNYNYYQFWIIQVKLNLRLLSGLVVSAYSVSAPGAPCPWGGLCCLKRRLDRAQMATRSTYQIQCVNEAWGGWRMGMGGGEGENDQKGKEMRGSEIKRWRGERVESLHFILYICVLFWIEITILLMFFIFIVRKHKPLRSSLGPQTDGTHSYD